MNSHPNYYRAGLVKIARKYRVSELDVARLAVDIAKDAMESNGEDIRLGHVGYYLVDEEGRTWKQG